MNSWIPYKRRGGQTPDRVALISIRPQAFALNAQFVAQANIEDTTQVSVFVDPSRRRIGFKFHSDSANEDSYSLTADGGHRKGRGRAIQATSLIQEYSWIAAVARIQDPRLRRFKPAWHSVEGMWVITLCPAFEVHVSAVSDIADDAQGIYRYRRGDEVVYIGRGIIRSRLRAPERRDWDFDIIEYSPLPEQADQEHWESYWLDQFVRQYGKLPLYNRIGGKRDE